MTHGMIYYIINIINIYFCKDDSLKENKFSFKNEIRAGAGTNLCKQKGMVIMMSSYKKITLRIISFLLLAVLLTLTPACGEGAPVETTADITADIVKTQAPPISFSITADYVIVRPDAAHDDEVSALTFLNRGIGSIYKTDCKVANDWVKRGEEVVPAEYEILIGDTNRAASKEVGARLGYNDYTYEIISENVIVILGGSPSATLEAARAFMRDVYCYEETVDFSGVISEGAAAELTTGVTYTFEYDYPVNTLKLGGRGIEDFTLVSTNGNDTAAKYITSYIASICGYRLPVVGIDEYTPGGPVIFFGCADASGGHLDKIFDSYTYYIASSKGAAEPEIIIDLTSSSARLGAAEGFISLYFSQVTLEKNLELPLAENIVSGLSLGSDSNSLLLSKSTETKISEGITYSELLYYDLNSLPVRAYVLTVSKGSGRFYTGTPADGEVLLNKGGKLVDEMAAAAANGKTVIAGVNADFFNMNGNYLPRGLCIKDGKLLSAHGSRPWFGVTTDGTPVIGDGSDYEKYAETLYNAVGGSNIMLANGRVVDVGPGTEFGKTRHPRTAVGFKANGDVVIIVVDGRQSAISNGASLTDLAKIFFELGCTDALNLDGGGSSTFVITDKNGSFKVKNSPSGGTLRVIQNSLLVLAP